MTGTVNTTGEVHRVGNQYFAKTTLPEPHLVYLESSLQPTPEAAKGEIEAVTGDNVHIEWEMGSE